jgi:hypothetical protein
MIREPFDLSLYVFRVDNVRLIEDIYRFNIAGVNMSSTKPHASISGFFDTLTTHTIHVDPTSPSESISPTRHPDTSPQTELKRPIHVPEDVWRELPEAIRNELIHYGSEALAPKENSASEDRKRRRLEDNNTQDVSTPIPASHQTELDELDTILLDTAGDDPQSPESADMYVCTKCGLHLYTWCAEAHELFHNIDG